MAAIANSNYTGCLLGMGNPLMDVSANVGQDMFDKYGLKAGDAVLQNDNQAGITKDLMDNFNPDLILRM